MAIFAYRIASGHIAKATLQGSSSYLLSNFPKQTDQSPDILWSVVSKPLIEDFVSAEIGLNGYEYGQGLPNLVWALSVMTPLMWAYWDTTFFSGGGRTAQVTIETVDTRQAIDTGVVFQCLMTKPRREEMTWTGNKYYTRVPFRFTRCEEQ